MSNLDKCKELLASFTDEQLAELLSILRQLSSVPEVLAHITHQLEVAQVLVDADSLSEYTEEQLADVNALLKQVKAIPDTWLSLMLLKDLADMHTSSDPTIRATARLPDAGKIVNGKYVLPADEDCKGDEVYEQLV